MYFFCKTLPVVIWSTYWGPLWHFLFLEPKGRWEWFYEISELIRSRTFLHYGNKESPDPIVFFIRGDQCGCPDYYGNVFLLHRFTEINQIKSNSPIQSFFYSLDPHKIRNRCHQINLGMNNLFAANIKMATIKKYKIACLIISFVLS